MAGWQGYIDNLIKTKAVAKAAIFGHDGSQWATSPGFTVSKAEHQPLFGALKKEGSATATLQAGGIKMNGQKFMFLKVDPVLDAVIGRKGDSGCIAAKTAQAVIYAIYENGVQPGDFNKEICRIQEYLKTSGY
ncbi:profilin-2-like [Amphiura filiformis]|uniref:profilin-2-like n=1 Tax=Amphiura filiformis TaxID=82378 RepID=UPI003B212F2C